MLSRRWTGATRQGTALMTDVAWPAVTVKRNKDNSIVWAPELRLACTEAREQGAGYIEIGQHYGVPVTSVQQYVLRIQHDRTPPDPRRLPCGCGVGRRCATAEALALAYQALPVGSRDWAVARQRYFAHVVGGRDAC